MLKRRNLLLAGACAALSGCIRSPIVANAYNVARSEIFGYPDLPITRQNISAIPQATMTARIGDGPEALLILGQVQGADQFWISGLDRSILVLREGRVVRTFGFPENLRDTVSLQDDPVHRLLHKLEAPARYIRRIDLQGPRRVSLTIESTLWPLGERTITIREIDFTTLLVRETNEARGAQWSFENFYWADPGDGYIWKSEQHIARSFDPVQFEILKPPAV